MYEKCVNPLTVIRVPRPHFPPAILFHQARYLLQKRTLFPPLFANEAKGENSPPPRRCYGQRVNSGLITYTEPLLPCTHIYEGERANRTPRSLDSSSRRVVARSNAYGEIRIFRSVYTFNASFIISPLRVLHLPVHGTRHRGNAKQRSYCQPSPQHTFSVRSDTGSK